MSNKTDKSILDDIKIASPCTMSWDNMAGSSSVRNCAQCKLLVYNISEMSKKEAEKLIQDREGKLCIRMYRRFDGTVITNDCPVGLRKIKQSLDLVVRTAAAVLSVFLSFTAVKAQDRTYSKNSEPAIPKRAQGRIAVHTAKSDNGQTNDGQPQNEASSNRGPVPTSNTRVLMGEPEAKELDVHMGSPVPQTAPNKSGVTLPRGHVIMGRPMSSHQLEKWKASQQK